MSLPTSTTAYTPKASASITTSNNSHDNDTNDERNKDHNDDDDDNDGCSTSNNNDSNFVPAVITLCLASLVNGLMIVSIFPYAGYMVLKALKQGDDGDTAPHEDGVVVVSVENVGQYVGYIAASFMIGRTFIAHIWGKLSDVYGRVVVLRTSLWLSVICNLWFGISTTFASIIISRFCLGAVNSITSTTKVLATEVAYGCKHRESQAMGLVVGMRSWGFLLGPAIGGLLSDPIKQYPSLFTDSTETVWYKIFATYPYVLPNLIIGFICLIGAITTTIYLNETLDVEGNDGKTTNFTIRCVFQLIREEMSNCLNGIASCFCFESRRTESRMKPGEEAPLLLEGPTSATDRSTIWNQLSTRRHMVCTWMLGFVVAGIDESFPLFCISSDGGLGLPEKSIGQILSVAGLIFALLQYVVYIQITKCMGLYNSIEFGSAIGLISTLFIPASLLFVDKHFAINVTYLGLLLGISKIMICMVFSSLAIATNATVTKPQRGSMNALQLVGGSIAKGLGPIFAGVLSAISFSRIPYPFGAITIFTCVGIFGILTTIAMRNLKTNYSHIS